MAFRKYSIIFGKYSITSSWARAILFDVILLLFNFSLLLLLLLVFFDAIDEVKLWLKCLRLYQR